MPLKHQTRRFFETVLVTLFVLFSLNTYFLFAEPTKQKEIRKLRSKHQQQEVFPAFAAQQILVREDANENRLLPLTGPSSSLTVFCQEGEDFLTYVSDRFGFHNQDALWDQESWQAAFVGDSFVQGACVPSQKNFVSLFGDPLQTANLGSYGNGPLTQLASLLEFAKPKKPKKVFWVYMQNDLGIDLPIESQSKILNQYLAGQTQNLASQQLKVNEILKPILESAMNDEVLKEKSKFEFLALKPIRVQLLKWMEKHFHIEPPVSSNSDFFRPRQVNWPLYLRILQKASLEVQAWGGEMEFVILPNAEMLLPRHQKQVRFYKFQLRQIVEAAGLPIIDLHEKFAAQQQPLQYFQPMGGFYGHFNEKGYALTARWLKEDPSLQ